MNEGVHEIVPKSDIQIQSFDKNYHNTVLTHIFSAELSNYWAAYVGEAKIKTDCL